MKILKNINKVNNNEANKTIKKEVETTTELEAAPDNYLEFKNLSDGKYLTKKGYTLEIKNKIAYIDSILIVNKTYPLPDTYQPIDSFTEITGGRCLKCLESEVMEAFSLMQSDASSVGINLYISSGYRSYSYQTRLYDNYTATSSSDEADIYSARPGHSEHQSGLCFDLNSIDDSFINTNEGKWVNNNAYLYGFIIRFPKGSEEATGYKYEPWHLRYVGQELAKKLYNDGNWLSLEEYYGISSSYS